MVKETDVVQSKPVLLTKVFSLMLKRIMFEGFATTLKLSKL